MSRPKPLILNIDDDEAGRYAVRRVLKQSGFEVIDAVNGANGIQAAEAHRPDLILLDIRLPDIDGFEVCRLIRGHADLAGTAVLQMSASYLDVSSRVKGLDNGADAYLTEPVEPTILVATINSLLRLKRAENSVRQTALEWQSTFDAIGEGVALLDSEGAVTRANQAFDTSAAMASAIAQCFQRVSEDLKRCEEEIAIEDRTVKITLDPLLNQAQHIEGAVCIVCDVTEKKRFESQIRQTARLESIGVLAGGIAHDFNNLLTGILGNSSLLLETLPAESPDYELVREIVRASESAADLTRQILAYSGKGQFVMAAMDLSALALESRAFVRRFIPPKVELIYETTANLPPVRADVGQMQQLLMNLIINAAESFEPGQCGWVRVYTGAEHLGPEFFTPQESGPPGAYVILRVADTGSGMDETTKSRIFDPFFTTKFTGRGLGLSAVHGILKAHNGILRVDSNPGEGTTFRLYFPALPEATPVIAQKRPEVPGVQGSGTVLVIDDESVVRTFARTALEMLGYDVLLAENGRIGVEMFRERKDDIGAVVLDLTMPVMDGEEAFARLRELSNDVPMVLSSGFSLAAAAEKFQGKGVARFIAKPFTALELSSAVEAAMRVRDFDVQKYQEPF